MGGGGGVGLRSRAGFFKTAAACLEGRLRPQKGRGLGNRKRGREGHEEKGEYEFDEVSGDRDQHFKVGLRTPKTRGFSWKTAEEAGSRGSAEMGRWNTGTCGSERGPLWMTSSIGRGGSSPE